ncbi:hypothetical protein BDD12DRAFT_881476 [Trichophaea hybrida]|nr:hypothetical protein BDD12DRAFT_881476 [Trichophaea hybrida]
MDPTSVSSAFEPTSEHASFRFITNSSPDSSTSLPGNYKQPSVEDEPEERTQQQQQQSTPPPPTNTTDTDYDLIRQCRICFETSPPPYEPSLELGRLLSPCVCRGSSRYVHSACLQMWRETSREAFYTSGNDIRNYLEYLVAIVWALGFVSTPILSTYLDVEVSQSLDLPVRPGGWAEHFLRGLASLGLLGFFKVIYLVGPGSWWSIRNSMRRDSANRISWIVIAVGVANFFVWLWRRVGEMVKSYMNQMAEDVMDIGDGGDGHVGDPVAAVPWGTWMVQKAGALYVKTADTMRWATGRVAHDYWFWH